jgi:hypothetical protein
MLEPREVAEGVVYRHDVTQQHSALLAHRDPGSAAPTKSLVHFSALDLEEAAVPPVPAAGRGVLVHISACAEDCNHVRKTNAAYLIVFRRLHGAIRRHVEELLGLIITAFARKLMRLYGPHL